MKRDCITGLESLKDCHLEWRAESLWRVTLVPALEKILV